MPMYICNASKGVIAEQTKSELASDITRIHCEMTEAPPAVCPRGVLRRGAQSPLSERKVAVACNIRAGRTDAQKSRSLPGSNNRLMRDAASSRTKRGSPPLTRRLTG